MKKEHKDSEHTMTDSELRTLLKRNTLSAPPSPWFTRKVLNSLPEKRKATASWAEYAIYLIAAVVTAAMGWNFVRDTLEGGVVRVGDLVTMATFIGLFIAICWLAVSPWIFGDEEYGE